MDTKQPRAPLVVDLGKQKKKKVNELKRGYGNLMEEVRRAVAQATDAQSEAIPVVVLFEKKAKRRKNRVPMLGPF